MSSRNSVGISYTRTIRVSVYSSVDCARTKCNTKTLARTGRLLIFFYIFDGKNSVETKRRFLCRLFDFSRHVEEIGRENGNLSHLTEMEALLKFKKK